MSLGPVVAGAGLTGLSRIRPGSHYATDVLPAILVFGLGLSLTVAPLTATVLAAVSEHEAGLASAVNNAVSRTAGLIAVAALPAAAGLSADVLQHPTQLAAGFDIAMRIAGGACAAGGVAAWLTIRNREVGA
jgi:hypothetical protein